MHWKKWTDLTHLKASGGMGFRDIRKFNLSMLGKHGWRLMANPFSLCARVLKGRYYLNDTFLSSQKKEEFVPYVVSHPSWKRGVGERLNPAHRLIRHIGDGTTTDI
jgi:hypothetical protein